MTREDEEAERAGDAQSFCACGRRVSECDGSRRGCSKVDTTSLVRLRDAGHREQAWAQQLVDEKRLPSGLDFAALMEHAMYDPRRDEVVVTVKAATLRYRVRRA